MGKHRLVAERTNRLAVVGAATVTVTALTVGAAAPQPFVPRPPEHRTVDLATVSRPFPAPGALPDGNVGTGEQVSAALAAAIVNRVSLPALTGRSLLDLSDLGVPGIKIITPGATFALLKLLGVDLGWTPGTPNAVADAIDSTPYFEISTDDLFDLAFQVADLLVGDVPLIGDVVRAAEFIFGLVPEIDIVDVRASIVAGLGFGAFAAGAAYGKALADLPDQPGGTSGPQSALGGYTVLPMVLLNNVGRANGGMLARFYPLGNLFGIDLVTPDTKADHSGGIPLFQTNLAIGGANLIPVKIDASIEYQPFSDFAAWPNPLTLANNLLAGTVGASYILRGVDFGSFWEQVADGIADIGADLGSGKPLAMNLYLTLPTSTLPLLEPLYLIGDVLNAVSFNILGHIPVRLANALEPALRSLVNLGYTDVVRNPDGTYTRTLADPGNPTPFGSFPHVNPVQVIADVLTTLVAGFHKEFLSGNPTHTPNVLSNLVRTIKVLSESDIFKNLLNVLTGKTPTGLSAANSLPAPDARMLTITTATDDDPQAVPTGKHAAPEGTPVPDDLGAEPRHALPEDGDTVSGGAVADDPELGVEPPGDEEGLGEDLEVSDGEADDVGDGGLGDDNSEGDSPEPGEPDVGETAPDAENATAQQDTERATKKAADSEPDSAAAA